MASVICSYRTSNDNRFYRGSASNISGKGSIRLDAELSAVEVMAAPAASEMAAIRLSVLGMAAGGMSAWLAGQAALPAQCTNWNTDSFPVEILSVSLRYGIWSSKH
jgi:hypothetical protein